MTRSAVAAVVADPDVGRRVLQCRGCSLVRAWSGRDAALALGWSSRWKGERREWACPSCGTPPPAAAPEPVRALSWVPDLLRRSLASNEARQRAALLDLLTRLADQAPSQCALTLAAMQPVLHRRRGDAAKWWRERVKELRALLRPSGTSAVARTQTMFEGVAPPASALPPPAACRVCVRRGAA